MKRSAILILGMAATWIGVLGAQPPGAGDGNLWLKRIESEQKKENEALWEAQRDPDKRSSGEVERLREELQKNAHERAQKVFEIEAANRGEDIGAQALQFILRECPIEDQKRALRILHSDYVMRDDVRRYLGTAGVIEAEESEAFLRKVADEHEDLVTRGTASYCLGQLFELIAKKTESEEESRLLIEDAKECYRRVALEFDKAGRGGEFTAMLVAGALNELEHLQIEHTAPELLGKDIESRPLRLSDFRGKVVALVFWATWCGPCMQMVPHERELVKRMKDRPFALVGVNGDSDREKVLATMSAEGMTWPSFYEGLGPEGTIPLAWHVKGWPTTYVLDAQGVIRFKNVRGKKMDEAIESLLAEIESATPRSN